MAKWEEAHEIVKVVRTMDLSKESLERIMGVLLHMIQGGNGDMADIDSACRLIGVLKQPTGIKDFLMGMKELDSKLSASYKLRG